MIITLRDYVIPAAYSLLPAALRSDLATRELIAIMYQESRGKHRAQIGGPARGFWQFEKGGVFGVLRHRKTRPLVKEVLAHMRYEFGEGDLTTATQVQKALEHNDILAAVFARLLLYTHPAPLPKTAAEGWDQYIDTWRPGKPHPDTWPKVWRAAGDAMIVGGGE